MTVWFAVIAAASISLGIALDRGKKNSAFRAVLVFILLTTGMFSCSATLTSFVGYKPDLDNCRGDYDQRGNFIDC